MSAEITGIIRAVQRKSGTLTVDGIAGPKTWAWIAWKLGADESTGDASATEPADPRSEQYIATLLPNVQPVARKFLREVNAALAESGLTIKIVSGTRSDDEQ